MVAVGAGGVARVGSFKECFTEDDTVSPAHASTSSELLSQQRLAVGTTTYLETDTPTDPGVPKVN